MILFFSWNITRITEIQDILFFFFFNNLKTFVWAKISIVTAVEVWTKCVTEIGH